MTYTTDDSIGTLADPDQWGDTLDLTDVRADKETVLEWYHSMVVIRETEEMIAGLVESGEAQCPCHLATGQEAVPVGVASSLRASDRVFGAHRSHGHFLALGGQPEALFAEVLGRYTGCSRGMGGSMHLRAPEIGLLGTVPIVSATIPLATGAALAAKMDGLGDIAVSFFGDGATEEGVFHESMNFAATHILPIIFICENNLFSSHLHISLRQPADSIARYAAAHGMPGRVIDGNDVGSVFKTMSELTARARAGDGPSLVEAVTYRWKGHVGHREDVDVGVQRDKDLSRWKQRDPIRRLRTALVTAGHVEDEVLEQQTKDTREALITALRSARDAPYPPDRLLLDAVYPSTWSFRR